MSSLAASKRRKLTIASGIVAIHTMPLAIVDLSAALTQPNCSLFLTFGIIAHRHSTGVIDKVRRMGGLLYTQAISKVDQGAGLKAAENQRPQAW